MNYNKILIIRLGAIGDVVHTTNTYRALKAFNPELEIHYLTTELIAPLLLNEPDLFKVWTINPKKIGLFSKYLKEFATVLKKEKFDLVINLQPSLKTKALVFRAGIKKQLIYKKDFKMHAVKNFWMTAKNEMKNIELPDSLKLYLNEDILEKMHKEVENLPRPLIVFNAGGILAKRQGRTYPIEKWLDLGMELQNQHEGTIIITGLNEDAEFLNKLNKIPNSVNYVGKLSLEENAALISHCDVLISGDSGPLHIASALGVKTVGLYGSMPILRTGIYGKMSKSIASTKECVPCNRRKCKYLKHTHDLYAPCMVQIDNEKIVNAISDFIIEKG